MLVVLCKETVSELGKQIKWRAYLLSSFLYLSLTDEFQSAGKSKMLASIWEH